MKGSTRSSGGESFELSTDDELDVRRKKVRREAEILWRRFSLGLKRGFTLKNIINIIFLMLVSFICLQQCFNEVRQYFKFKTKNQVSHTFPQTLFWLLPGITVCNNNRIRLSKLIQEVPALETRINSLLNTSELSLSSESKRLEIVQSIKKLLDGAVDLTAIVRESPIPKLIELSSVSLIKDVKCNTVWGKPYNCANMRIFESYQGSPCYTLFYLGSILESIAKKLAYNFEINLMETKRKNSTFGDHEIAEILIDFEPLQHADFNRDIGGQIHVHTTGHVGSIKDIAHTVLPGHKYEIIISRSMTKRLPPPYTSQCHNYKRENSYLFATLENPLPSIELDRTTAVRNCVVRKTTKACDCWPVEVPYFPGDTQFGANNTWRLCSWGFEDVQRNYSAALYVDCFKRFHAQCRESCRHGCRTEDYEVHIVPSTWPTRDAFYRAKDDEERIELQRLRGCCAILSIKYLELMQTTVVMYPALTLPQLVSNIGGIVSALVGVSGVTIYRFLAQRVFHGKVVSDYVPPPRDQPAPVTGGRKTNRLFRRSINSSTI